MLLAYSTLQCPAPVTARYLGQRVPEFQFLIGKLRAILEAAKEYVYGLCQLQLGRSLSLRRFNPNP